MKNQPALSTARAPRIRSCTRRDETTLRLGGFGDNYHLSWAADDRQYVAICDGAGWLDTPKGLYNSRLWAISGGPQEARFHDVQGYPDLINQPSPDGQNRYYGFGTLALDGYVYQFLSTPDHPFSHPDGASWAARFIGAKLIYSPNDGRNWYNQDGSTPVVWELWQERSRKNMVFFEESQDAFSLISVLQMGRNYQANRDGYLYLYAPNGSIEGTMNELVMARVPRAKLLDRQAYEFFAGLQSSGTATWAKDIEARAVVHTFPRGWVNTKLHPWAWMPSVAYNSPLGLYMMASWGIGLALDGTWFGKPSYLGLWAASNPWGPWTQIHEEAAWTPDNDQAARAFAPQISPKWIAEDGKSFWLVWSDFQQFDEQECIRLAKEYKHLATAADRQRWVSRMKRGMPYYSFNTQRVDLQIA